MAPCRESNKYILTLTQVPHSRSDSPIKVTSRQKDIKEETKSRLPTKESARKLRFSLLTFQLSTRAANSGNGIDSLSPKAVPSPRYPELECGMEGGGPRVLLLLLEGEGSKGWKGFKSGGLQD